MRHIPVLLKEVINSLNLESGMKIADCTLGDGGHAEALLKKIGSEGKLLGIDADSESLQRAKNFLHAFEKQITFVQQNFSYLKKIVQENNFFPLQAILIDLGWSTPQFKERKRGFSFYGTEVLDMRFEHDATLNTAEKIINESSVSELEKIFHVYGEEPYGKQIAEKISEYRKNERIQKTDQLVEIILQVYREKIGTKKQIPWIGGNHPATKVFQALRIAVNDELEMIKKTLPQALEVLDKGGRLAVITFHSLEDRIVKHFFQSLSSKQITIINKKPIVAESEELFINPSSRSAKLRVVQKN